MTILPGTELANCPGHRQHGCVVQARTRRQAGANHHPAIDQPARWCLRKRFDDDLERRLVGDVADALTIKKFGQDSEVMSLAEEIHSARTLHVTDSTVTGFGKSDNGIVL